jgi:hypothetical protein
MVRKAAQRSVLMPLLFRCPAPESLRVYVLQMQLFSLTQNTPTPRAHTPQAAFMGAVAVADLVKSTLGPKGMDKILQVRPNMCIGLVLLVGYTAVFVYA